MKITRLFIVALALAPLAWLNTNYALLEMPSCGKLRVGFFQLLENRGAMTSNVWN